MLYKCGGGSICNPIGVGRFFSISILIYSFSFSFIRSFFCSLSRNFQSPKRMWIPPTENRTRARKTHVKTDVADRKRMCQDWCEHEEGKTNKMRWFGLAKNKQNQNRTMDHACKEWNDYLIDKDLSVFFYFCLSSEKIKRNRRISRRVKNRTR